MSKDCTINDLLLARNGVSQSQRYIDALDPNSVKLHDLTTEDWMRFALRFSKKVNYFDTKTNKIKGNWNDFFVQESEIVAFAKKLEHLENQEDDAQTAENNIEPHLTLFAAFLKLTSYSQKRLNSLSKKHLDFYYKEVLKLNNKAPVEDKVHVLFDLAKNASEVKIDQYSSLYGKKDAIGIKRIYKTQEEIVVNKTAVASLRSIYLQDDGCLKNALVANSFNGARKDFPDGEKRWWPFGYPDGTPATVQGGGLYPYLPFAKTGFGLSSPVLLLKEGIRTITFTFEVSNFDENDLEDADLSKAVSVFFSGEKVWIEGVIQTEGDSASSVESGKLILVVVVDEGKDSIVNYDKEVLLEPYRKSVV